MGSVVVNADALKLGNRQLIPSVGVGKFAPHTNSFFRMLHGECYTARSSCGARTREHPHWESNCGLPNFEASALTTTLPTQRLN